MSQLNSNMKKRSFKHLSEKERYQIEILLKEKMRASEIAKALSRHVRTIEREISRGTIRMMNSNLTYRNSYCADAGHRVYKENGSNKGPGLKIGNDHKLAKYIEKKIIKEKYSPDALIGEITSKGIKFKTTICTKTVYNYIDSGVFANITNKDLPCKRNKKKGSYRRIKVSLHNLKGTSISERPKEIDTREEFGHWEMDCVEGKKGGAALLVLTERKSREEIIRKIPKKNQVSVKEALDKIEKKYGENFKKKFKTVTVDNGIEFLNTQELERSIQKTILKRFKVYYAHPYSSWERGSNENANKLIRRFIPKGVDIGDFKDKEINRIEHWMNNYPRRIHGYKTAREIIA